MPEAQVGGFLSVLFPLPSGRQTLPSLGGSLGLAASFLPFLPGGVDLSLMSSQNPGLLSTSQGQMHWLLRSPSSSGLFPESAMAG